MEAIVVLSFILGSIGFAFGVDAKLRLAKIEEELAEIQSKNANK